MISSVALRSGGKNEKPEKSSESRNAAKLNSAMFAMKEGGSYNGGSPKMVGLVLKTIKIE